MVGSSAPSGNAPTPAAAPAAGQAQAPGSTAPPPVDDRSESGTNLHASVRLRRWESEGMLRVSGDATADEALLRGVISVGGALSTRRCDVRGVIDVFGPTKVSEALSVRGTGRFHSSVLAPWFSVDGRVQVQGSVDAPERADLRGTVVIHDALRTGPLTFDGTVRVAGPVSASTVEGWIQGQTKWDSLRAGRVSIHQRKRWGRRAAATLTVGRIDGTELYLEGVRAEHLKAEKVTLGPDCHIAHLTGTVVSRHRSSHVGPEALVPLPYGLTP